MMKRLFRNRRRVPLVAAGALVTAGLAAGFLFDRIELRGVVADPAPEEETAGAPANGEAAPGFAEAFAEGLGHFRRGDAHAAARAFEAARRADPHVPEAYLNLGFAYLEMGRPEAARVLFEQTSAMAPGMANPYFGLAEALEALGDIPGARGAMRTYLHLAPEEDPFRKQAMAALWEWEATNSPAAAPEAAAPEATEPLAAPQDEAGDAPMLAAPLQTLDGEATSLAAYRGRIVVVNVWATWCGPCRMELPSLDRLAAALDPQSFAVVGVSIDRERVFTREFLRELGIDFANYWDRERRLAGELIPARTIPITVILSREGEAVLSHTGARDWSEPALVEAITGLADQAEPFDRRLARLEEVLQ